MADMITMIVCDQNGKVENCKNEIVTKDNTEGFYTFFALKDIADKSVKEIFLTMPVGGTQNGLLRLPCVGEKILVAQQGNSYFMMAYLPDVSEMEFREKENDANEANKITTSKALTLRYKSPNVFPKDNKGRSKKEFSEIKFSTEETYWPKKKDTIKKGGEHFPKIDRIDVTSAGDVITTAQNYNEVNASRVGIFAGVHDKLEDAKKKAKDIPKDGKTTINGLEVLPFDIPDEFPKFSDGDVHVRADQRIVLNAQRGITLRCGRSIVTIDDAGICLKSGKISSVYPTPDDSSVSITPRSGVSISGDHLSLNANINYSISEGMGGSISSIAGVTRIDTHDFRVSTNATVDYSRTCLWAGVRGAEQAGTYLSTILGKHIGDGEGSDHNVLFRNMFKQGDKVVLANSIIPLVKDLLFGGDENKLDQLGVMYTMDETSFKDPCSSMISIANIILKIMPIIYLILDYGVPIEKKKDKAYAESINTIDSALSYGILACLAKAICTATAGVHYNSFALKGNGNTDIITKKLASTTEVETTALSPVAGYEEKSVVKKIVEDSMKKGIAATTVVLAGGGVAIWQVLKTQLYRDVETMKDLQEL